MKEKILDDIDFFNEALKKENVVMMPLPFNAEEYLNNLIGMAGGLVEKWLHLDPDLPAVAKALKEEYYTNFVHPRPFPFKASATEYQKRVLDFQTKLFTILHTESRLA